MEPIFKTVQVERAHTEVSKQIARKIISGEFEPGQVLPTEGQLTTFFEVSRVVVREALRSLAQRGLLEQSQGRRTVVRPSEDWDIFDVMILSIMREEGKIYPVLKDFTWIRLNLEPQVAADAARLDSPEQLLTDLEGLLGRMEQLKGEHEGYYAADLDFHARLAASTGNRVLYRLMKVIGLLFHDLRRMPRTPYAEPSHAIADHRNVIKAIASSDPEGASRAMRSHMEWTFAGVTKMYGSGQKLDV